MCCLCSTSSSSLSVGRSLARSLLLLLLAVFLCMCPNLWSSILCRLWHAFKCHVGERECVYFILEKLITCCDIKQSPTKLNAPYYKIQYTRTLSHYFWVFRVPHCEKTSYREAFNKFKFAEAHVLQTLPYGQRTDCI